MKKKILILSSIVVLLLGFTNNSSIHKNTVHAQWTILLKKYVTKNGDVDYKGFTKDSAALNAYLNFLSSNAPEASATKNEKFAFWINAYNAFTVKLIIQHYPLKSIKDLGTVATNNSPWDKKFIPIRGETITLNTIEHEILRKEFNDPRLHFAINCASYSCPKLLNSAFESSSLDNQLDERARDFINDPSKNIITPDSLKLSSILLWYEKDFTKSGITKIDYLNRYSKIKIKN